MRPDGRQNNQLRPISISTGYQKFADGSALIRWGDTWVLCAASIDYKVPAFRGDAGGWVTAEYNMLPGSTQPRKGRRTGGREKEIQRLIGRSLRATIDLGALGEHTITVDCDVLQADGGTRVASITGGYVALVLAARKLVAGGKLEAMPPMQPVAAVSVGIVDDEARLDLPYVEDSAAQVDMNIVMMPGGKLIEVQGTAEHGTFDRQQLDALLDLAGAGVEELGELQARTLKATEAEAEVTVTLP